MVDGAVEANSAEVLGAVLDTVALALIWLSWDEGGGGSNNGADKAGRKSQSLGTSGRCILDAKGVIALALLDVQDSDSSD